MPRKAFGEPKTKRIERRQTNGDIYVYEVTTLYNPKKRYNEHISSKLLGKKSANGAELLPTRPRKAPGTTTTTAVRKTVGVTDILAWIGRESGIDDDVLSSADKGTAQKIISIARFWMAASSQRRTSWNFCEHIQSSLCAVSLTANGFSRNWNHSFLRCKFHPMLGRKSLRSTVSRKGYAMYSHMKEREPAAEHKRVILLRRNTGYTSTLCSIQTEQGSIQRSL